MADQWVPAGERYRVAYGYRSRLLNVHRSIAYAVGIVRSVIFWISWDLFPPVSPSFVEILDRFSGASLRRWTFAAEASAPVSTMEFVVKDLTADLMLLDVDEFEAKYGWR